MHSVASFNNLTNYVPLNSLALELSQKFCMCPQAHEVLKDLPGLTEVIVDEEGPQITTKGSSEKAIPHWVKISIPTNIINSDYAIYALASEIFNAKNSPRFHQLTIKGITGEIDVDAYALAVEKEEWRSKQAFESLLRECQTVWQFDPKTIRQIFMLNTIDDHIWFQEVTCHTDFARGRWIDKFQKPYCQKHPEDARSCTIAKVDLCDSNAPLSEHTACQRLSKASKATQEFFQKQLCILCPEVYEKTGKLCPKGQAK